MKTHLANINPFVNIASNFPVIDWQADMDKSKIDFSNNFTRPDNISDWRLHFYINSDVNKNYHWLILPMVRMPKFESSYVSTTFKKEYTNWQIFGRAYTSPGVYYLHSNLKKYFLGLSNKIILKAYLPFFNIKRRAPEYVLSRYNYYGDSEESWFISSFNQRMYNYFFSLVSWNWLSSDASLAKYFLSRRYRYLFSDWPLDYVLFPTKNDLFIYRSNIFWLNYMLYLTDIYNPNLVRPVFDSVSDVNMTSHFGEFKKSKNMANAQLNEFFIDFSDYDFFNGINYRADILNDVGLSNMNGNFEQRILSGNYAFFSDKFRRNTEDYAFFKNFYYRYKYKFINAFYIKSVLKLNDFYVFFLDLKSENLNFSLFYVLLSVFKLLRNFLEKIVFSIFFLFYIMLI